MAGFDAGAGAVAPKSGFVGMPPVSVSVVFKEAPKPDPKSGFVGTPASPAGEVEEDPKPDPNSGFVGIPDAGLLVVSVGFAEPKPAPKSGFVGIPPEFFSPPSFPAASFGCTDPKPPKDVAVEPAPKPNVVEGAGETEPKPVVLAGELAGAGAADVFEKGFLGAVLDIGG